MLRVYYTIRISFLGSGANNTLYSQDLFFYISTRQPLLNRVFFCFSLLVVNYGTTTRASGLAVEVVSGSG